MLEIKNIENGDKDFWFLLNKHLSEEEFNRKLKDKEGYVLVLDKVPIGILRYNLFRDNIPFCKMIYIWQDFQRKGYGKILLNFWEEKMKN